MEKATPTVPCTIKSAVTCVPFYAPEGTGPMEYRLLGNTDIKVSAIAAPTSTAAASIDLYYEDT